MSQIGWGYPRLATVLHLLRCLQEDSPLRQQTTARLTRLADQLVVPDRFWTPAISAAQEDVPPTQVLASWLADDGTCNATTTAGQLQDVLQSACDIWAEEAPQFEQERALRLAPLQQQWSAYGPGYLHRLGQHLNPHRLPESIRVVGLAPFRNGWGHVDVSAGSIHLEAMMVNIDDRLPEVARLAWLITWLALAPQVTTNDAAFAALTITVELCQELEWFPTDEQTVPRACTSWRIASPGH